MPMVSRVRDALRRLIDDYGSSDEEKGKAPAPNRSKKLSKTKVKDGEQKIFFRPSGTGLKTQTSVDQQSQSSSNGGSSEDDPTTTSKEQVEEHPIFLSGLLGTESTSDASAPTTAAVGTGVLGTGVLGTGVLGTGALGTGALGTGALGTEVLGTGVSGTGVLDESSERVRAFAHFPGNWATFVYLIPRTDGLTSLFHQLTHAVTTIPHLRPLKWSLIEEPHISLSRTVPLRFHEIPHFTAHLKAEIVKTSLPRFAYSLEDVGFFKNDQVNTSFLAIKVGRGQEEMTNLLRTVDTCLKSFNMPPFYENPQFHVSFAWSTERLSEEEKKIILSVLQAKFDELRDGFLEDLMQNARAVHCKSGNRTYLIPL